MNTKIVMPRLANAIGSKAKASFAVIKTYSGELHSVELGLVTAVLFAPLTSSRQRRFLPHSTSTPDCCGEVQQLCQP
jgi:hypothetical protein